MTSCAPAAAPAWTSRSRRRRSSSARPRSTWSAARCGRAWPPARATPATRTRPWSSSRAWATRRSRPRRPRSSPGISSISTVTLNVPLVDVATWKRVTAAGANLEAARGTLEARADEVERAVVRAFYQWVGNAALVRSGQVAEKAAQDNLAVVEQRAGAGLASALDVSRARAQVARARESIASAQLGVATAQRTLRTLTGIEPAGEAPPLPADSRARGPDRRLAVPGRQPARAARGPGIAARGRGQRPGREPGLAAHPERLCQRARHQRRRLWPG